MQAIATLTLIVELGKVRAMNDEHFKESYCYINEFVKEFIGEKTEEEITIFAIALMVAAEKILGDTAPTRFRIFADGIEQKNNRNRQIQ